MGVMNQGCPVHIAKALIVLINEVAFRAAFHRGPLANQISLAINA
jgi:hypothetical protein